MWAIHIVAADDDARQLKALCVGVDVHLCSGLAGCIGVGRRENAVLQQVRVAVFGLAVDFVSGDVDEFLDSNLYGGFQHDVRTTDISFGEGERIAEAEVDMRLSSEV